MSLIRNLRRQTRETMEATLPTSVFSRISLLYPPSMFLSRLRHLQREKKYRKQTQGLPADVVVLDERYHVHVAPDAIHSYLHFAWIDERMVTEMGNFLRLTRGKKCLYDVGALHGVFSFAFVTATGGRAMAFEPSPLAAPVLNQVRALNPQHDVAHFPFAIGSREGELTMRMDWQHLVAVSGDAADGGNIHRVKVETLDHFAQANPPPDCMKVDVEGFEHEVLLGAQDMLARHRPLLFLEIHPLQIKENRSHVRDILALLTGLNYEILGADLKPFPAHSEIVGGEEVFNLICR